MINIYLDVDGVLLSSGKPAKFLDDFIAYLDKEYKGSIYWLTTHCSGSTEGVMAYMKRAGVAKNTLGIMSGFKPTSWPISKVEAIDFSKPFLWFEDKPSYVQRQTLAEHKALDNLILVNLESKPNQLQKYVEDFPLPGEHF